MMNPYDKYKEQAVMTMTPGEMVVRLFEEVINQMNRAIISIEENNLSAANSSLQKSQRIINHLRATLDNRYEISAPLRQLYDFFLEQIIKANVRKDIVPLQETLPLVEELKDAFAQGERLARIGSA